MPRIVLGPYFAAFTVPGSTPAPEPTPTPAPEVKLVGLSPLSGEDIQPGGLVTVTIDPASAIDGAIRPSRVFAFYLPHDQAVDPATRTVEQITNSGTPYVAGAELPADAAKLVITVPAPAPGLYDVHTLIEYPA